MDVMDVICVVVRWGVLGCANMFVRKLLLRCQHVGSGWSIGMRVCHSISKVFVDQFHVMHSVWCVRSEMGEVSSDKVICVFLKWEWPTK